MVDTYGDCNTSVSVNICIPIILYPHMHTLFTSTLVHCVRTKFTNDGGGVHNALIHEVPFEPAVGGTPGSC